MGKVIHGCAQQVLKTLPDRSINCCVTSPPYWGLRDYGVKGQLGLENTPDEYVAGMVKLFREVRRVLKNDGTLWLNLGDSYNSSSHCSGGGPNAKAGNTKSIREQRRAGLISGLKAKDLVGIPWRVAFALQADGWYLRADIIWHKPNCLPTSAKDRPTTAHEYVFLLSKAPNYYYDREAILEPLADASLKRYRSPFKDMRRGSTKGMRVTGEAMPRGEAVPIRSLELPKGRNKRSVWSVTTKPFKGAHFATFPPDLIEPCVLAGSPKGGTVLDPFFGAGTTGLVAQKQGRDFVGVEINPEYVRIAEERLGLSKLPLEIASV